MLRAIIDIFPFTSSSFNNICSFRTVLPLCIKNTNGLLICKSKFFLKTIGLQINCFLFKNKTNVKDIVQHKFSSLILHFLRAVIITLELVEVRPIKNVFSFFKNLLGSGVFYRFKTFPFMVFIDLVVYPNDRVKLGRVLTGFSITRNISAV